ncbi:flagellin [Comamonas thiooxydans]|uniref:flagellin n=1 Tax=Comamonas thiooxydans TaxID=363952 RepID=UPI000A2E2A1E|nr:flagellin [Comamonas thiooxydans]BDR07100.1 flagellin [Comamonas thiooxydans]
MAMTINTNIQSLNAQRNLGTSQSSLSTSMQRLSSGMRINSAKDDAAGLAIAERMSAQVRGLNQAQRNANDGVSLAQTAEGALSTIGGNLQRIRELAVQSRNATNSTEDRAALQKEVDQLKSEISRVATDTSFNGTKLLDGSFTAKEFQVGANQGQTIKVDSIVNADISKLGTWNSVVQAAAPETAKVPTGSAAGATAVAASAVYKPTTAFTNGQAVNIKVDGATLNFSVDTTAGTGDAATLASVNAGLQSAGLDGSYTATYTAAAGLTLTNKSAGTAVPPKIESGTTTVAAAEVTKVAGTSPGDTVFAATSFSLNGATIDVGVTVGVENRNKDLVAAINAQTGATKVTASLEDGKLKLTSDRDINIALGTAPNAAANAAALTAQTGLSVVSKLASPAAEQTGFSGLDISTVSGADNAILAMDAALKSVNSARADLGAIQNRFESVVSNLSVNSENLSASKSRITDADFAAETANLSRSQILQQAGTAMVAQANQLPQGVLSLLR